MTKYLASLYNYLQEIVWGFKDRPHILVPTNGLREKVNECLKKGYINRIYHVLDELSAHGYAKLESIEVGIVRLQFESIKNPVQKKYYATILGELPYTSNASDYNLYRYRGKYKNQDNKNTPFTILSVHIPSKEGNDKLYITIIDK